MYIHMCVHYNNRSLIQNLMLMHLTISVSHIIAFLRRKHGCLLTHSLTICISLTSACCVYSNVYTLDDAYCIRYLTVVYSSHSTSPAVHTNHSPTSVSVEFPL